jgi:hypothetical protein
VIRDLAVPDEVVPVWQIELPEAVTTRLGGGEPETLERAR